MLRKKYAGKKFLLASQSPRRQELLKGLDIDFEIVKIDADESYPEYLVRHEITEHISQAKSKAYTALKENEILITADTLVWLNDEVLGKPQDYEEAVEMLKAQSEATQEVFTSITIRSNQKTKTFSETTKVIFDTLTEEEIRFYLDNYKPFDKAGAYGIQEWMGYAKISRIEGCYYNVMGLPLRALYQVLMNEEF